MLSKFGDMDTDMDTIVRRHPWKYTIKYEL